MSAQNLSFTPDYATPPGVILEDELAARGISHDEFAEQTGQPAAFIADFIQGQVALEHDFAKIIEAQLGIDATIFLSLEANYRRQQNSPSVMR
ncbi:MAG: hypothetical protein ORN98_04515 [Alphaproteobacteria bacterium]|nr:hypothetical protein [Alphaproteobacteria bacterium]